MFGHFFLLSCVGRILPLVCIETNQTSIWENLNLDWLFFVQPSILSPNILFSFNALPLGVCRFFFLIHQQLYLKCGLSYIWAVQTQMLTERVICRLLTVVRVGDVGCRCQIVSPPCRKWRLQSPEQTQWADETSGVWPTTPSSMAFAETWLITYRENKTKIKLC